MAFPYRKGKAVYVYYMVDGKQTSVPRKKTKHLDNEDDATIERWVAEYSRQYEKPKRKYDSVIREGDDIKKWIQGWYDQRLLKNRDEKTLRGYRSLLERHVIPFFFNQPSPMRDPNDWPTVSIRLLPYLQERITAARIPHAYIALRQLWNYLDEEGIVITPRKLKLRNPAPIPKKTPLRYVRTPDEILEWIENQPNRDLKLMALFGYFFSLRPYEIFAIKKVQIRAGSTAAKLECCKTMAGYGLFDKFAVYMEFARSTEPLKEQDGIKKKKLKKLKTSYSLGWVACFDERAAELLLKVIKDEKPDDLLFREFQPDWYLKMWAANGIPETVLKDTRRSSLYYLGLRKNMQPLHLKQHARHSRWETTLLYCRRPDEEVGDYVEPDLAS